MAADSANLNSIAGARVRLFCTLSMHCTSAAPHVLWRAHAVRRPRATADGDAIRMHSRSGLVLYVSTYMFPGLLPARPANAVALQKLHGTESRLLAQAARLKAITSKTRGNLSRVQGLQGWQPKRVEGSSPMTEAQRSCPVGPLSEQHEQTAEVPWSPPSHNPVAPPLACSHRPEGAHGIPG